MYLDRRGRIQSELVQSIASLIFTSQQLAIVRLVDFILAKMSFDHIIDFRETIYINQKKLKIRNNFTLQKWPRTAVYYALIYKYELLIVFSRV